MKVGGRYTCIDVTRLPQSYISHEVAFQVNYSLFLVLKIWNFMNTGHNIIFLEKRVVFLKVYEKLNPFRRVDLKFWSSPLSPPFMYNR